MAFNKRNLKALLKDYDSNKVECFIKYCDHLLNEKKDGKIKNIWFSHKTDIELADMYKSVAKDNLEFDGKHITILKRGVSYDYVAYKNKMFQIYPETIFDISLVFKGDTFNFSKQSGRVVYNHVISNPFNEKDDDIVGGYCVIKNKRGEFLTKLSRDEFEKHRKIAQTDYIWKKWYKKMCLKTVVRDGCSTHFNDIYQNMITIDNENYDLEKSLNLPIETKQEIEELETIDQCKDYYNKHSEEHQINGTLEDFTKELTNRKIEIQDGF